MYRYPETDLDRPDALLALLGSFWSDVYGGADLAAALLFARARLDAQAREDLAGLLDACSRLTVRPLRADLWRPLALRASARAAAAVPWFGSAGAFGGGAAFGAPAPGAAAAYPAPAGLAHAPLLFNRLSSPSRAWVRGVDFELAGGLLVFREDPLADPLVPAEPVRDGGGPVDLEATLWAFRSGRDEGDLRRQYGYALGVGGPGTPATRDLINAASDAAAIGPSESSLRALFAAALGVPLAAGGETVEDVFRDRHGLAVVTDARCYRFAAAANPVVAPGDRVAAGDPLCDALRFDAFGRGEVPAGLRALAHGPGAAEGYLGGLVWEDREVPVEAAYDPLGRLRVSWPLGGDPADVRRFWDEVHARGAAGGRTLADCLDTRPVPAGPPGPSALPASVNPLAFLCRNVLRNNAALVRVRPEAVGPGAPGWGELRALRRVAPPQTLLVVLAEYGPREAPVTMDGPGTPDRPGGREDAGTFPAQAARESVGPGGLSERARLVAATPPCGD